MSCRSSTCSSGRSPRRPTTGGDDPAGGADVALGAAHVTVGSPDVIGIGVDLVDIDRFRRSLERTPSMRTRLFTEVELAYVAAQIDPVPSLAARFAAREAVMKALGVGLGAFGFHDVWVVRAPSGQPSLEFAGRAAALSSAAGVTTWHLSLTHSDLMAAAYVIAD